MSGRAIRSARIGASAAAIAAATLGAGGLALNASASTGEPTPRTGVYTLAETDVASLRALAATFPDPVAAAAAGRVDLDLCFDKMGDHYADPATFADGVLDVAEPEALVFADVDGVETLVAMEWVSTAPGEVAGIPLHLNHDLDVWVLHAWIGVDNPSGMLADHNPDVGPCEPAAPLPVTQPHECHAMRRSPGCV